MPCISPVLEGAVTAGISLDASLGEQVAPDALVLGEHLGGPNEVLAASGRCVPASPGPVRRRLSFGLRFSRPLAWFRVNTPGPMAQPYDGRCQARSALLITLFGGRGHAPGTAPREHASRELRRRSRGARARPLAV